MYLWNHLLISNPTCGPKLPRVLLARDTPTSFVKLRLLPANNLAVKEKKERKTKHA